MRILVADEFPKHHLDSLRGLGLSVDFRPGLKGDALAEAAKEASILVVRSTEVSAKVFEVATGLSLVVRAGAGVNTIDVKAASARGVFVANCPGQNAIAVAELTFGLMLSVDRHIPDNVAALRQGVWNKKRFSQAKGLYGRTLGIVGLGAIGVAVAERAQAFGMKVVGYSRSFTPERAKALGIERAESLLALARQCEVLTVHVPATADTKGLVSRQVLAALPDGATFINTSRADVVDTEALLEEARRGRLFVATDVLPDEPKGGEATFQSELGKLPHVYATHHIGASTEQAQDAIARETVRIVDQFLNEGVVPNCVNVAERTPARYQLIVRHHDRVGVLANVLDAVRQAGINAQEIENTIFEGAHAACCKIQLDSRPPDEMLERIRSRAEEIIFVDLVELRS
ncbi:3-phosphoglycerate dehydrogenase family protein [Hyalangium rubrum]|uniref:D-3-phosphoglycerate dehydrogenase n=1 Tax=Hyalangium rubrum TaxID=3103134 RepID=A0ABU5H3M4_9BACT|nr:3-phosphoglycerate dehydrogenase family protein [Hyalangium sp. s54d21]MDY7228049.1 3-phosphoglycerate dehydrogenase family protein [Hyalangium sp. s54d21]